MDFPFSFISFNCVASGFKIFYSLSFFIVWSTCTDSIVAKFFLDILDHVHIHTRERTIKWVESYTIFSTFRFDFFIVLLYSSHTTIINYIYRHRHLLKGVESGGDDGNSLCVCVIELDIYI